MNELREVTDWHKLGVQLEVPSAKLKEIEKNYTTDTIRCKTEVLDWWLRNQPEISWKKLAQAVEKMGGYASLAQNLRMKISATSKGIHTLLGLCTWVILQMVIQISSSYSF